MKRFILTIALLSSALVAGAQTSIEEVLRSVETNNKELQANRQMVTAQKLEAKLDNNLPDPTVTYSHLYGNKEGMGFTGELVASQSFDFPSLYMQRNKICWISVGKAPNSLPHSISNVWNRVMPIFWKRTRSNLNF